MSKTAQQLIDFVKTKIGTNYVYGMKGAVMTEAKYNSLKKSYPSYVPNSDKAKIGTVCVDCSGLISWLTGLVRGSSSYKSTAVKILPISDIAQAVPGCALWKSGHIGVYIGDGNVIEAKGSAYGTVKTKVSAGTWTHILWLCDIDYSATASTTETVTETTGSIEYIVVKGDTLSKIAKTYDTTVDAIVSANKGRYSKITANYIVAGWVLIIPGNSTNTLKVGQCTGNGVNVRSGPGTNYSVLRQLNKGNLFDIFGVEGDWTKVNIVGLVGYVYSEYVG